MTKRLLLALAAAALAAGPVSAQRPIVPGEVTRGSLSSSDPTLDDDTYYDEWAFEGRRGETVVITMRSDAFDSFLHLGTLRRGAYQEITSDDDGGGGTNSRIETRLPEDGVYVIRANSLRRATGAYTLTLAGGRAASNVGGYETDQGERRRPGPARGLDERGGILVAGQSVSARLSSQDPALDNGSYFDLYTYEGRRGERLTIDMRSTEFDAYLVIGTRGGRHGVETALSRDDDSGGNRNARITFTLPYDGEFVIRAGSIIPGSGAYTLDVQSSLSGGYPGGQPAGAYDGEDDFGTGIDSRLTGRWGLTIPGVRVDHGDWASVTANASMGILNVDGSGAYTWRKNGRVLRGQLVPFTPRRDARAGTRYYLINDGRDEFYVFFTSYRGDRYMQVNSRGTDTVVAYGYREGGM